MLDLAFNYEKELNEVWGKVCLDKKYTYFNYSDEIKYTINTSDNNSDYIQFVSLDSNKKVIGYFIANVNRIFNNVTSIAAAKFEGSSFVFARDLKDFILKLFLEYRFRKISFYVLIGNKVEKMYDKFVENYNGRIVGIEKDAVLLHGVYLDNKLYEIFRDDFIVALNKKKEKKFTIKL